MGLCDINESVGNVVHKLWMALLNTLHWERPCYEEQGNDPSPRYEGAIKHGVGQINEDVVYDLLRRHDDIQLSADVFVQFWVLFVEFRSQRPYFSSDVRLVGHWRLQLEPGAEQIFTLKAVVDEVPTENPSLTCHFTYSWSVVEVDNYRWYKIKIIYVRLCVCVCDDWCFTAALRTW